MPPQSRGQAKRQEDNGTAGSDFFSGAEGRAARARPRACVRLDREILFQGSLRDTFCNQLKHGFFNTKVKGSHHLQGNVQVNNVRIPVFFGVGFKGKSTNP